MTNNKQYSFWRGLSEVSPATRREIEETLMRELNIKFDAYKYRRRGDVEPSVSEAKLIEDVFAKFGVPKSKIWGPKLNVAVVGYADQN